MCTSGSLSLKGSLFQYFSRKKSTAMVAWCKEVDARDIVEVSTEADFTECRNLPSSPVLLDTEGGLDGFLVRRGQRPRYFVSRDLFERVSRSRLISIKIQTTFTFF